MADLLLGGSIPIFYDGPDEYVTISKTLRDGTFFCPVCKQQQAYRLMEVTRYCTLVCFIPLFPMGKLDDYVECMGCKKKLDAEWGTTTQTESPMQQAVLTAMIRVMMVDGIIDSREVDAIQETQLLLFKLQVEAKDIVDQGIRMDEMSKQQESSRSTIQTDLEPFAKQMKAGQRSAILRALAVVAIANEKFEMRDGQLINQVGFVFVSAFSPILLQPRFSFPIVCINCLLLAGRSCTATTGFHG